MRIRLLIDIVHDEDVADLAELTADQPVATITLGTEAHDASRGVFFGRFMGATPVEASAGIED
jgi:hypothetical protein